jgi:hypothetical protein
MSVQDIQFLGKQGIILNDPGTLTTDRTGLATCTATFKVRKDHWQTMPNLWSPHPIFGFIGMEHRELSFQGPFAVAVCKYAGVDAIMYQNGNSSPVYDLCVGVSEEPIETHPDFASFAGSPMSPINGANFRLLEKGTIVNAKTATKPEGPDGYVFDSFDIFTGDGKGGKNKFAKVESYLEASQLTWRMTYNSKVSPASIAGVGLIGDPIGPAPRLAGKRNWLFMGITSTKRGSAYQTSMEWRASGRSGWIEEIYGQ